MYFSVKSTELNVFVFGKFSTSRASGTRGKLPPRFFAELEIKKCFIKIFCMIVFFWIQIISLAKFLHPGGPTDRFRS